MDELDYGELKPHYFRALELPARERAAYLQDLEKRLPHLASPLRALLDASDEDGFLDAPLTESLREGERVGPFVVRGRLGVGGMGAVYIASRSDGEFEHDVAIKVVKRGMDTEEVVRRFRSERQILAQLTHPNIAQLHSGGVLPDGRPYFVMEHVDGPAIDRYCEAEGLGVEARVRLFLQVLNAVAFAHQHGIIHRDIKPSNILVAAGVSVGNGGRADAVPKLLDFGIAKLLDSSAVPGVESAPTLEQHRRLTPDFASPEALKGGPSTMASDVFSLGVVLYRVLTGRAPYEFREYDPTRMAQQIRETRPTPPGALCREVSKDLEWVIARAMAPEASQRYTSVSALREDLARLLEGRPVSAGPVSLSYRASCFIRRHRVLSISVLVATLALVGSVASFVWHVRSVERERRVARTRFDQLHHLASFMMFDAIDALADLPGSSAARRLMVSEGLRYLDGLQQELQGERLLALDVVQARLRLGDVLGAPSQDNMGEIQAARTEYERALQLLDGTDAEPAAGPPGPETLRIRADLHERLGDVWCSMSRTTKGIEHLETAARIREALLELDPEHEPTRIDHARGRCILGNALTWVGRLREAEELLGAVAAEAATSSEMAARCALANLRRAEIRFRSGSLGEAEQLCDLANAAFSELCDAAPLNARYERYRAQALLARGRYLAWQERYDEGLAQQSKASEVLAELARRDPAGTAVHRELSGSHVELARTLDWAGRTEEAVSHARAAEEISVRLAQEHPESAHLAQDMVIAGTTLAHVLTKTGALEEAREILWRSRARAMLQLESDPGDRSAAQAWLTCVIRHANLQSELGDVLAMAEEAAEALERFAPPGGAQCGLVGEFSIARELLRLRLMLGAAMRSLEPQSRARAASRWRRWSELVLLARAEIEHLRGIESDDEWHLQLVQDATRMLSTWFPDPDPGG